MLSSEGQAMETPAGRQGKENESLAWLPWIPGCTPGVCLCQNQAGRRTSAFVLCRGGKIVLQKRILLLRGSLHLCDSRRGIAGRSRQAAGAAFTKHLPKEPSGKVSLRRETLQSPGPSPHPCVPRCAPCPGHTWLHGGVRGPDTRKHHPEQCGSAGFGWRVLLHPRAPRHTQRVCRAHS